MFPAIYGLRGWQRNIVAFLLGVSATFTLAPFYIFPLIIPAYAGLFLLVNNTSSRKRSFADGWWWGWGFYISGLYWFCIALLTDAEKFAWAIPFALFGLNAIIALYPAIACLIFFVLFRGRKTTGSNRLLPIIHCLGFSLVWLFVEYARGHLFSGFPWNLAGYAFGFIDVSLQSASIFGAYGLTLFAVLLGVSVAIIRTNRIFTGVVWGVFFLVLVYGYFRLENSQEGKDSGSVLRLVQADIKQHHKWNPDLQQQNLEEYIKLTQSVGIEKVTHVVWPETAVPYALRSDTPLTRYIGAALPSGISLVTGTLRMEGWKETAEYYNSVVMINNRGQIIGNYDKHALVPFGEFLPFRFLIPKSLKLPVGDKDFSTGEGAQTVNWAGIPPVSPLICYEGIFPEFAVNKSHRPDWLLNITNDAWFGMSSGPYQHFEMARMRSVEQGLPLVRVGNTGITAYIDEYGRIKQQIGLGEKGIIDIFLKQSSLNDTTYIIYGNFIIYISLCILIFLTIFYKKLINC